MAAKLTRLFLRALERAPVSVVRLAEEAGYHYTSFQKYQDGSRTPTPDAAEALAKVLRRRGRKLTELADQLEQQAKAERKGGRV